jgi:L-fucose isomerase-like protein
MAQPKEKTTFALYLGNRGVFPGSLIAAAREEMVQVLAGLGHKTLVLDADATRYGAVETPKEGESYARFLKAHQGEFGGVILCLPNFGDETGAAAALRDAGVPILVQAYPDDLDKMGPALRRDAFCGKLSILDVFYQNRIPFTTLKPHTVAPGSPAFADNVDHFDRVCRVVGGLKRMVVGAVGARTTAFKTVRIDELALEQNGITMETFDLADVFGRIRAVKESDDVYKRKAETLRAYADFSQAPPAAMDNLVRLGVVLDQLITECQLDAVAVRCWLEMQQQLSISPCVILSELNDRGVPAACEVDVGNAIAMYALSRASGDVAACLDWNNNYGDDENKCILFHCGPVPASMMTRKGQVIEHAILVKAVGPDTSYGCNVGRIRATPFTFASMMTESGWVRFYAGEGRFTEDPIAADFFGCAGVAEIDGLQDVLLYVGRQGHRHHVGVTPGSVLAPLCEAFENYLGYDVSMPQNGVPG